MKKTVLLFSSILLVSFIVCGCDIKDLTKDEKKDIDCSVDSQYKDEYGFSYYIEGKCNNKSDNDYDYLQVEFICYDKEGNNLGTAVDNTNNLLKGQSWKFKAMFLGSNSENVDHCDYHEVTGW